MKTTIANQYKEFISWKNQFAIDNEIIKNFWVSTRWMIKQILKNPEQDLETYVTLCPFYDKTTWWIKWDYNSFAEVWQRYKDKLKASLDTIEFLNQTFNLKVNFILADRWIMVNNNYNSQNLENDINWILDIYNTEISKNIDNFKIITFSDMNIWIDQLCNTDESKNIEDIKNILSTFWVDYDKFNCSLQVIIQSFWLTWAYYLVLNYLQENKQLIEMFEWKLLINTEACSPLNSLYAVWTNKITSKNLFARIDI